MPNKNVINWDTIKEKNENDSEILDIYIYEFIQPAKHTKTKPKDIKGTEQNHFGY